MPLLSDTIVISYASGMTLSIVAETRPVDTSVVFAMSIPVASIDFVQAEDCVVVLIWLRTINAIP